MLFNSPNNRHETPPTSNIQRTAVNAVHREDDTNETAVKQDNSGRKVTDSENNVISATDGENFKQR